MKTILFKYIFKEICLIFWVSIMILIMIILATEVIKEMTELIVNQGLHIFQLLLIIISLLPRIIMFSLPAACLMCVLLTFLRLSADNEVVALNASGISLYQLLPPVIVFSSLCFIFSIFISIYAVPFGNTSFQKVRYKVIESASDIPIKERIFHEPIKKIVFYVGSYSTSERIMKEIFIVDKRGIPTTSMIIAKEGKIQFKPREKEVTIHFINGMISTVDNAFKTTSTTLYGTYDFQISLDEIISNLRSAQKGPKEMSISELVSSLRDPSHNPVKDNQIRIKLFEMFSIPIAIFLLGVIGAPLGAHVRSKGRPLGIVLSLLIFLIYYISLMSVRYICELGILEPVIGVWLPDLFLLFICIYIVQKVANDHPILLLGRLSSQ
ncbi:MAG: LptF/LptG family permease [Deltaproteobacteria bacterium]|nr:LptF/LptG family permease [Deltaproteobacteria bacterium]